MQNSPFNYSDIRNRIEKILLKSTQLGGFSNLSIEEMNELKELSIQAEAFEDEAGIMPIQKPKTLVEMLRYKMFEMNLRQKQLAELIGMSETRLSELLAGKRKLNIETAKKLHQKLNIDAEFLLLVS